MERKYILAIDAGTTGIKVFILDKKANVITKTSEEFTQYSPASDRVEHDPVEIWDTTYSLIKKAFDQADLTAKDIVSIGITNQRATCLVWDRHTGEPIFNAIVWQDTRAMNYVEQYRDEWGNRNLQTTGLAFGPAYSSLMVKWMFDNVSNAQEKANNDELLFGTIDTWLAWKLTNGKVHATSYSNASATGAYDITNLCWYDAWLNELNIPIGILPEVRDDSGDFGVTDVALFGGEIPITSLIADQHAAMFAQDCREAGHVKCTHGTGSFLDVNIGSKPIVSNNGINTILGWKIGDEIRYAMEGYVGVTGAAVQWLRDGANLIERAEETEVIALSVEDNGGVYFVPALTGLNAPYWDAEARGMIIGIHRGTKHAHLVRATLEGIVYSIKDFLETIATDSNIELKSVKVDGGGANNNFTMQFQADMLEAEVVRPLNTDATILGAAFMAGLAVGYWKTPEECYETQAIDRIFKSQMNRTEVEAYYERWSKAISKTRNWMAIEKGELNPA